ncbi:hypothetical protein JCM12296A_49960 [Desulfosarcina cetonica]|uniref:hypothetical protein n=1 Tax=Desulfosarcina cetonica TaxID=90730 RepID=UPI001C481E36|nr:hypothetical protein [Desulfosarcina cetonica]
MEKAVGRWETGSLIKDRSVKLSHEGRCQANQMQVAFGTLSQQGVKGSKAQ